MRRQEEEAYQEQMQRRAAQKRAEEQDKRAMEQADAILKAEEARLKRDAAVFNPRRQRSSQPIPDNIPEPPPIVTCSGEKNCWDGSGRHYDPASGGMWRSDGKFCYNAGNRIVCP
jgi:DNA-binding protein H-NS